MTETDKLYKALEWGCLILASLFTLSFVYVATLSMTYPFHIEWMEGHMLDTVQRVLDGKQIYAKPSIQFIPYLYTPYYYYAVAFVSLFTGLDFFAGRLVSTLSALGVGWIIYSWVRKEGGSWIHGLIGAGLFFSTYKLSGRWLDTARVDSLFLLLSLGGLYIFFHRRDWQGSLCAAVALAAAFFTKQSALIIAAPVFAAFLFISLRHTLITGALTTLFIGAGLMILEASSHGWSNFYLFELPSYHYFDKRYFFTFWTNGLLKPQLVVAVFSIIAIIFISKQNKKLAMAYGGLLAGLILCSYVMRLNSWSYINVYIPSHAAFGLFAGLSLRFLASRREAIIRLGWPMFVIAHLLSMSYNPNRLIPSEAARLQGEKFVEELAAVKGDVFIPDLQFVQTRAGKKSYAFGMAAFDIFNTNLKDKTYIKQELGTEISEAIKNGRFDAVVPGKVTRLPERKQQYIYKQTLQYPTEYLTGIVRSVPMDIYVRRDSQ